MQQNVWECLRRHSVDGKDKRKLPLVIAHRVANAVTISLSYSRSIAKIKPRIV